MRRRPARRPTPIAPRRPSPRPQAIYTRMWGWCDHVRMPLVAPELIRRIQSVFVSTQSSAVNSSWSGPRHT